MNTALLLIEYQNDCFPSGKAPVEKSLEICAKAQNLLQAFREKKMHIIHIQHISTHPDATYYLPCTKGAEICQQLQPAKNETVIKKHYPNSFKDTQLLNHLIKNQINHLLVAGMTTHLAIDATVRAGHDLGFNCTVLHDACASRQLSFNQMTIAAQDVHYAFLAALESIYASITSTDDYLQRLAGRISTAATV